MNFDNHIKQFLIKIGFFLFVLLSYGQVGASSENQNHDLISQIGIELLDEKSQLVSIFNSDKNKPAYFFKKSIPNNLFGFSFQNFLLQHNRLIHIKIKKAETFKMLLARLFLLKRDHKSSMLPSESDDFAAHS